MKHKRAIWLLFLCCFSFFSSSAQTEGTKREFRALWVTTAFNLDWPSDKTLTPEQQQKEFIHLLEEVSAMNMNAVIVQVRAAADAFYDSPHEPWSAWLTGEQGRAPAPYYDPLEFMITEAHKRGIELHAWFNLFRAVSHRRFSPPVAGHVSQRHPEWLYEIGDASYFNPGVPEARDYLIQVITDVASRYDVDGIHLDDYFYAQESWRKKIDDEKAFKQHNPEQLSLEDWRRENINKLVNGIHDSIKAQHPDIVFGISPPSIWRHQKDDDEGSPTKRTLTAYDDLYADTRLWLEKGWVDYMIPQLYWSQHNSKVSFDDIAIWWDQHGYSRHIYSGHALYKAASSEKGWDEGELQYQIDFSRSLPNFQGNGLFRASDLLHANEDFKAEIQRLYPHPALPPAYHWLDSIPPAPPGEVSATLNNDMAILTWNPTSSGHEKAHMYVIYRFGNGEELDFKNGKNIVGVTARNFLADQLPEEGRYIYIITSLDKANNESVSFSGIQVTY